MSGRFSKFSRPGALSLAAAALLAGCETTGDPMEGGLFGWSEEKAQARLGDREAQLAAARAQRSREAQTGAALRGRTARNQRAIGATVAARREADAARDHAAQRAREEREQQELRDVLAKAETLERDSPSPAISSRARRLRGQIERTARAPELTRAQKEARIRVMDAELDRSRSEAGL